MMWSTRSQVPWGALDLGPGSSRYSAARTRLSSNWRSRFRRPQEPEECRRHCMSRSEEHTSELQSLMRISYAVFCLKTKTKSYRMNNCLHTNNDIYIHLTL